MFGAGGWYTESLACSPILVTSAAYIQVHFGLDFIMEANTMTPDLSSIWLHTVCNICYLRT